MNQTREIQFRGNTSPRIGGGSFEWYRHANAWGRSSDAGFPRHGGEKFLGEVSLSLFLSLVEQRRKRRIIMQEKI